MTWGLNIKRLNKSSQTCHGIAHKIINIRKKSSPRFLLSGKSRSECVCLPALPPRLGVSVPVSYSGSSRVCCCITLVSFVINWDGRLDGKYG